MKFLSSDCFYPIIVLEGTNADHFIGIAEQKKILELRETEAYDLKMQISAKNESMLLL